ncbi:hypothetical protein HY065_01020 [Candidatus Berkelbacteria bacterium]|nr:hypothetical protein [Candidatus Berkelbacteria bacterium]
MPQYLPFKVSSIRFKRGFGLIEAVFATGILAMIAAGAVVLNTQALRHTAVLADRLTAFEWAQEGVEVVRQIRDTNLIDGRPETDWKCFDPDAGPSSTNQYDCGFTTVVPSNIYRLDTTADGRWKLTLTPAGDPALNSKFTPANYPADGYFTREIRILDTTPADPEKRLVQVTVSFKVGVRPERVKLSTILTNWRRET